MKKYSRFILLIGLLSIFSSYLKSQDHYTVTRSIINIRDGAGVEYNKIGRLKQGDEVLVYEIRGDWAKIHFLNTDGYVNTKYLQLQNQAVNTNTKSENVSDNAWIWIAIIVGIIIWITITRYTKKCSNCKKWNAMKVDWQEKVDEKQSHIRKSETLTDIKGNKHTNYYSVPATVYYYHVHRKCKHCGNTDYVTKSNKVEN